MGFCSTERSRGAELFTKTNEKAGLAMTTPDLSPPGKLQTWLAHQFRELKQADEFAHILNNGLSRV